jgi:hypothetical protein
MSGGSYDYLCYKDPGDLINYIETLESMANRLQTLKCEDGAAETYDLIRIIKQSDMRISTIQKRLSDLWHAVEWFDSCDFGEEDVMEAINKYRCEVKDE